MKTTTPKLVWLLCALAALAIPVQADDASITTENQAKDTAARDSVVNAALPELQMGRAPNLRSGIALIYDEVGQRPLYSKGADTVAPIASITKLMTARVVLDARLPMDETITLTRDDEDRYKRSRSRMQRGMTLTRGDLLKLALLASENRAAHALARTYPGGTAAVVELMNKKAHDLGMNDSHFTDPTGLHSDNVSTAQDLVKLVLAAQNYPEIHDATTSTAHSVDVGRKRQMNFRNTNPLVRNSQWEIGLSKTGYISEAGRCLVMETRISQRPVVIVLLDSWGKRTRVGDANRVKRWMEISLARTDV
jgi:D-alanyl-D-alanine endopeptidase (penicillin-binding protein 7)